MSTRWGLKRGNPGFADSSLMKRRKLTNGTHQSVTAEKTEQPKSEPIPPAEEDVNMTNRQVVSTSASPTTRLVKHDRSDSEDSGDDFGTKCIVCY
jgi:hypothetical protein